MVVICPKMLEETQVGISELEMCPNQFKFALEGYQHFARLKLE